MPACSIPIGYLLKLGNDVLAGSIPEGYVHNFYISSFLTCMGFHAGCSIPERYVHEFYVI